MGIQEYKAWLDGMIAATGDERLKMARAKLDEVIEAAPAIVPSVLPAYPSPTVQPWVSFPYTTCISKPTAPPWSGVQ